MTIGSENYDLFGSHKWLLTRLDGDTTKHPLTFSWVGYWSAGFWDVKEAVTKKEESSICHIVMLPSQITWQINRIVVGETESTTHRYDPANHDCCRFFDKKDNHVYIFFFFFFFFFLLLLLLLLLGLVLLFSKFPASMFSQFVRSLSWECFTF